MVTEVPSSFVVRKHKATGGIRGNKQEALLELTKTKLEVTNETIRSKTAKLMVTRMTDGQDPYACFLRAALFRRQVE